MIIHKGVWKHKAHPNTLIMFQSDERDYLDMMIQSMGKDTWELVEIFAFEAIDPASYQLLDPQEDYEFPFLEDDVEQPPDRNELFRRDREEGSDPMGYFLDFFSPSP